MASYKVMRQHYGDREYQAGDTREAKPEIVAHLVASGVLEEVKVMAPVETKKAPGKK